MEAFGWSAQETFHIIVILAVIEVPVIYFGIPESLSPEQRVPFDKQKGNPLQVFKDVFGRNPFFTRMMGSFGAHFPIIFSSRFLPHQFLLFLL